METKTYSKQHLDHKVMIFHQRKRKKTEREERKSSGDYLGVAVKRNMAIPLNL